MNDQTEVIILKNTNFKDNDGLINVISNKYGKLTFKARGINKINSKNVNGCNLFNKSRFIFNYEPSRGIQNLRIAESIKMYRHIREDLNKQAIASFMCEVVDKCEVDDENVFDLLDKSLTNLNLTKNIYVVLGLFVACINSMIGISAEVDYCVKCHSTKNLCSISLRDGGFICENCFDSNHDKRLKLSQLKFFRLFSKANIDNFEVIEKIDCEYEDCQYLIDFFREYSGVNLKSQKFLEEIVNLNK